MPKKKQFKVQKPAANFEDKWKFIHKGIYTLFDFIGSDGKKPFNPEDLINAVEKMEIALQDEK